MESSNNYDLSKLNFDHLRRNFPWQSGLVRLEEEFRTEGKKTQKNLRQFRDLPMFLPVQLKAKGDDDKDEESKHHSAQFLRKQTTHAGQKPLEGDRVEDIHIHESLILDPKEISELNLRDEADQADFLNRVELIKIGKAVFNKPIAIIYNPNSGKKRNLISIIENRMKSENVPYELMVSTKYFMTWELAETLEIDKYSAIVAVGGDGTFHEVTNGMLSRKDQIRIPIGFIPNGSGNDTTMSLGIFDVDKAIDFILKGDLISYDLIRVTLDSEDFESIPDGEKVLRSRYSLLNTAYSVAARVNHGAIAYKGKCSCGNPYQRAALKEFCKIKTDLLDIYVDGKLECQDQPIVSLMCMNTKLCGGGFVLNPYAVVNDGLLDFVYMSKKATFSGLVKMMDQATKLGGVQGYETDYNHMRAKSLKIVNKNVPVPTKKNPNPEKEALMVSIDGEDLFFREFVKSVVLPGEIQILCDFNSMMKGDKHFL